MIFNTHSNLRSAHAFLSPSKPAWSNYEESKLDRAYLASLAAQRGTELHAFAHDAIRLGVKLQGRSTLAVYVNDAIGYRLVPEQILYFSDNCFGTADAIGFRRGLLRIHDLKTGVSPASMRQLEIYAALFCLEYMMKPNEIRMELRLYQNNDVTAFEPEPDTIFHIMDRIRVFDRRIEEIKQEAL